MCPRFNSWWSHFPPPEAPCSYTIYKTRGFILSLSPKHPPTKSRHRPRPLHSTSNAKVSTESGVPPHTETSVRRSQAGRSRPFRPDQKEILGLYLVASYVVPRKPSGTVSGAKRHPSHSPAKYCSNYWLYCGIFVPGKRNAPQLARRFDCSEETREPIFH